MHTRSADWPPTRRDETKRGAHASQPNHRHARTRTYENGMGEGGSREECARGIRMSLCMRVCACVLAPIPSHWELTVCSWPAAAASSEHAHSTRCRPYRHRLRDDTHSRRTRRSRCLSSHATLRSFSAATRAHAAADFLSSDQRRRRSSHPPPAPPPHTSSSIVMSAAAPASSSEFVFDAADPADYFEVLAKLGEGSDANTTRTTGRGDTLHCTETAGTLTRTIEGERDAPTRRLETQVRAYRIERSPGRPGLFILRSATL